MSENRPGFVVPTQFVRTATGLVVPVGALRDAPFTPHELARIARSQGVLLDPAGRLPTMLDQIVVVADEAALQLPASTLDDVRGRLHGLPFVSALARVATLAAQLWSVRDAPAAQRQLLERLVVDRDMLARYDRFLAGPRDDLGERLYVLSEQQLQVLQRLVIEETDDREDETWTVDNDLVLQNAFLGVTTLVGEGAARLRSGDLQLADWVGFLTQNGSFNASGQPLYALVRAHRLFVELSRTQPALDHPAACDFDAWVHGRFGIGAEELFAVGFAAQATTLLSERSDDALAPGVLQSMGRYLGNTAIADKAAEAEEALSAPRDFFVSGFARSRDNPLRLAWEGTPFQQRPFLRLTDGRLALTSPRGLYSWLTDGWYYRLLEIAIDSGERDRFTTFVGFLFETYVLELMQLALHDRDVGRGRVHGEIDYGGGQKTSDVIIDYGEDLLLFEVVSRRLPLGVRAEAEPDELETHLQRAFLDKIAQLDRVATDVWAGRATIPGVVTANLRRVWPVLVTAGDVVQSEALWEWLRTRLPAGTFGHARVERLSLLDVEDIEILAGMIGQGEELVDVLAEKARSTHRELSLVRWIIDTRGDAPSRHPELEARWKRLVEAMESVLKLEGGAAE